MGYSFYTVQLRDLREGLLGIARRYYGDPWCWPALYELNQVAVGDNPALLRPGQQLLLPAVVPNGRELAAHYRYIVELRDIERGLAGVAERLWGEPGRWSELYALNRGTIGDDPARLVPGQWLLLP